MGSSHANKSCGANLSNSGRHHKRTLRTLISAFESSEGLKQPLMKSLYLQLFDLSLRTPMCCSNYGSSLNHFDMELEKCWFTVTDNEDVHKFSDVLFKEFGRVFEQYLSALHDVSVSQANQQNILCSDMWVTVAEVTLLLRCCMLVLTLPTFDPEVIIKNVQLILSKLNIILSLALNGENGRNSIGFKKSLSCKYTYADEVCATSVDEDFVASLCVLEPSDIYRPFVCAVLEVFADELLMHKSLREYFILVDPVSSANEMLFACPVSFGDIGTVLEVISAHFILSVSGQQAYEIFVNRLYWWQAKDFRVPELSLNAALSLLQNPIMLSAPKIFQAHFILLVCDAIGIDMSCKSIKPDVRLMDYYLTVFEKSVNLYTRHMSSLHKDGYPLGHKSCPQSFESSIKQSTKNKIIHLVSKSDNSWSSYSCNTSFGTKSDVFAASIIAYMEKSRHVFDEACEDEILPILFRMVVQASDKDSSDTILYKKGETSSQDIYLLASLLKLMSSSLLQAIWCLRYNGNLYNVKSLKDASSCKEYNFLMDVIGCFEQFNLRLPIQQDLQDMMDTHPKKHKKSKWMLMHILGLLSLSFVSGLDFLVKGCTFMTMTLMNLFIFEEGNLDVLKPLLASELEAFSSKLSSDRVQEAQMENTYSQKLASKFQKIQKLHMRTYSLTNVNQCIQDKQAESSKNISILTEMKESALGMEEEREVTCSGEIFLNCVLDDTRKSSDFEDLADFIECKKGKDYSDWLKGRQTYRKWKCQRMSVLRWERKKRSWKCMKGKRS